ncbi:MAG TPA: malonyl-CoA decarboxylase family protein [Terriglobales bacterium]|nr:malonyl-CoA decarboxylase family protein [Terriglobales bacterium]
MPEFFSNLLRMLRGARGTDMRLLCSQLLSQRGEASQTVLAQRILEQYGAMNSAQQLAFFEMLARDFGPDAKAVQRALEEYNRASTPASVAGLAAAAEPPRQELFRRINTAPAGTPSLVALRRDLLRFVAGQPDLSVVDADLKHLFRSWFNRGFLRLERIGWHTPARTLEKLIEYESVHEINGWPDLRRRLEADRRCFAFFQPALSEEPVIFVEVALTHGLARSLEPLLDITAPVLPLKQADTAIFYSINNCLDGLRGIPFGNFLIKQVVEELGAELPQIKNYSTLSPLPHLAPAIQGDAGKADENSDGFTRERLSRLLHDYSGDLKREAGLPDAVAALLDLLKSPLDHQKTLAAPLRRLALAYVMHYRRSGKPYDPVAAFHFSNGARLESIDTFANLRPYGLRDSFGVMVNYRYVPEDLEENHERFVRSGEMRVSSALAHDQKTVSGLWNPSAAKERPAKKEQKAG